MPVLKKRSPSFPPITNPNEWIYFNWERSVIVRGLERSVSKSTEWPMPDEFKIENGCVVRRLDTNSIVASPLSVCRFSVLPKLFFIDFFGYRCFAEVFCEVIPGSATIA